MCVRACVYLRFGGVVDVGEPRRVCARVVFNCGGHGNKCN